MEYNEVKALVEYYEERIKTNFDYYFNQLVLMDFFESDCECTSEDVSYYQEYFSDYNEAIIYILIEIGDEGEEFYDLKLRLIHLKRIVDNKIALVPKDILIDYEESQLIHLPNVNNKPNPFNKSRDESFIINPKIDQQKFIKTLHKHLIEYSFITDSYEKFNSIFKETFYPTNKVQWHGTELQIAYLISSLIDNGLFDVEVGNYKFKLISIYFTNKKGNDFSPKQLGAVHSEKKHFLPEDDAIRTVINEMSTHL
jgi:hypothetical protein